MLLSQGELGAGQALAIALLLVCSDLAQHGPEPLVGDNVGLLDARLRVDEDAGGKKPAFVTDLNASVLVLVDAAPVASERKRLGPGLDEVRDALESPAYGPRQSRIPRGFAIKKSKTQEGPMRSAAELGAAVGREVRRPRCA